MIRIPIAILYKEEASFPFNFQRIQNPPTPTAKVMMKKEFRD